MMFDKKYLTKEIDYTVEKMDAILTFVSMTGKSEYSLHERQMMTLQWKALDQYKSVLSMQLDLLNTAKFGD